MTIEERIKILEEKVSRQDEEVKARAFCVVDENGKPRAVLGVGKEGSGLALYDENEKLRALLSVDKEGPRLDMFDKNGICRSF